MCCQVKTTKIQDEIVSWRCFGKSHETRKVLLEKKINIKHGVLWCSESECYSLGTQTCFNKLFSEHVKNFPRLGSILHWQWFGKIYDMSSYHLKQQFRRFWKTCLCVTCVFLLIFKVWLFFSDVPLSRHRRSWTKVYK